MFASIDALKREPGVKSGKCQSKGCNEPSNFLRAWLHPQQLGKLKLATLNGVRYCAQHAYELSVESGIPFFLRRSGVLGYHRSLLERSEVMEGQPELALSEPGSSIVGRFGLAQRRTEGGAIRVHLDDGEEHQVCCYEQAVQLISKPAARSTPPGGGEAHSPGCRGPTDEHTHRLGVALAPPLSNSATILGRLRDRPHVRPAPPSQSRRDPCGEGSEAHFPAFAGDAGHLRVPKPR